MTGIWLLLRDRGQRVGVVLARARDPHDVATGRRQLGDLLERRVDVGRRRRRHRLHRHGEVAPDPDLADLDLAGLAPRGEDRRGQGRHTEGDAHPAIMTALGGSAPSGAPNDPRQPKSLIGLTMSA